MIRPCPVSNHTFAISKSLLFLGRCITLREPRDVLLLWATRKEMLIMRAMTVCIGCLAIASLAMADVVTYDTSLASPGYYNGTGNPNTNFTVATESNLELGLEANLRFIGPVDPGAGSSTYLVPAGSTSGDANWDFLFSINTADGQGTASTLANYTFTMNIVDTTASTTGPTFDPVTNLPDDSYYGPSGKTVGLATLVPADFGAQNAENLSFAGFLPGFNPNAGDTYDITLNAYQGSTLVDSDSITVEAIVPTPEPSAIILTASLLFFLVGILAKRRQRSHVNNLA
jgi:hypothetical protein